MKAPSISAAKIDGKWTVSYIGDDADQAKAAHTAAVNGNHAEAAMLFIRPAPDRRFRAQPKAPAQPQPKADAAPAKATKGKA